MGVSSGVDAHEALDVLGVGEDARWTDVRQAYRQRIRAAHPDVSDQPGATASAARLSLAYATLRRLRAEATAAPETAPPPPPPPHAAGDPDGVYCIGTDTIVVPAPSDEAFARLLDAAHRLGSVSFIDRSSGFLEAVVTVVDGPACSVVISLQGRATGGTEAFVTIEPLGQGPAPPVDPFTAALAASVAARWSRT